jgi:hypothetical protein
MAATLDGIVDGSGAVFEAKFMAPRRSKWNRLRVEAIIAAPDLRRFGQWGRDDGSEGCIYARAWFEPAMEACRPKAGYGEATA